MSDKAACSFSLTVKVMFHPLILGVLEDLSSGVK
jgi:hypothetical protein